MKLKILPFLFLALTMTACGSDSSDGTGSNESANTNSNFANANPATHRLEFPKLKDATTNIVIVHNSGGEVNYSVEYDTNKKLSRWSCYEIYASNRETHTQRYHSDSNQYPQDPQLDSKYRWSTDPFWRSGYSHGHLCPSADRLNSYNANYQTFYLTNMLPQNQVFNGRTWEYMETWVRNQITITSKDTLYVVKGGTIDNASQYTTMDRTGGKLIIPKYYFMAVLMRNSSGYKAMGFWIEHKANSTKNLTPYVVNIDKLESLTGIDFFCNLPDDIENHVESLPVENVKKAWGFK